MEDDSWMDRIAEQARKKYSQAYAQKENSKKQKEEDTEREERFRRILEDEMQKDREWRERVMKAAAMNNSEEDEKNWVKFEDLQLQAISMKDIPWPSGPSDNILVLEEDVVKRM